MRLSLFAVAGGVLVSGCRSQPPVQEVGGVIQLSDTTLQLGAFQTCGRDSVFARSSRPGVVRRSAYFSEAGIFATLDESADHPFVVVTRRGSRRGPPFGGDDAARLIQVLDKYGC